jgi:hypothetical protein
MYAMKIVTGLHWDMTDAGARNTLSETDLPHSNSRDRDWHIALLPYPDTWQAALDVRLDSPLNNVRM